MIRVISKYRLAEAPKIDAITVNIMRGYSILSNPFIIGRDGDRSDVIGKYRVWLWDQIAGHKPAYREFIRVVALAKKGNVFLKCCCKPEACHGDVLRSAIEWYIAKEAGSVIKPKANRGTQLNLEFK